MTSFKTSKSATRLNIKNGPSVKAGQKVTLNYVRFFLKLDIENPIIRINTAFKGCSSLEKISVLPRIYHN